MPAAATRNSQLSQIHIAKKDLGLDDETYREALWTVAHVRSAKDLDMTGRYRVLEHFKSRGWKPKPPRAAGARRQDNSPQAKMIRGLWIELHQAGIVRDSSERALTRFAKRLTGVDALEFATGEKLARVIEALKAWLERGH